MIIFHHSHRKTKEDDSNLYTISNYHHMFSYPACYLPITTGTPLTCFFQSFRTRKKFSFVSLYITADRDRTVSQRSEPSSRTTFISEQLNPWNHLQLQDVMSRHRGAKPLRRYELLEVISLLSLAYLLFAER